MAIPIPLTSLPTSGEPMRAAVYRRFGPPDVIRMETVARPEPQSREIRVRVMATTVTAACTMMRRGDTVLARLVLGLLGPRKRFQIAGTEFAGIVEKVGAEATGWRPGDRVFGFAGFNVGTYAEAFCLPAAGSVSLMPAGMSFDEAASLVDGPTTALYFFTHLAKLRPGEQVLVIGASGSVGGAAVQVARAMGARVTGVYGRDEARRRPPHLVRNVGRKASGA